MLATADGMGVLAYVKEITRKDSSMSMDPAKTHLAKDPATTTIPRQVGRPGGPDLCCRCES